jgi:hypothetical protein
MVKLQGADNFHKPVELRIAWYPYDKVKMEKTGDNVWKMASDSLTKEGNIPVLLVRHPDSDEV